MSRTRYISIKRNTGLPRNICLEKKTVNQLFNAVVMPSQVQLIMTVLVVTFMDVKANAHCPTWCPGADLEPNSADFLLQLLDHEVLDVSDFTPWQVCGQTTARWLTTHILYFRGQTSLCRMWPNTKLITGNFYIYYTIYLMYALKSLIGSRKPVALNPPPMGLNLSARQNPEQLVNMSGTINMFNTCICQLSLDYNVHVHANRTVCNIGL